jgi:hypothetical protein
MLQIWKALSPVLLALLGLQGAPQGAPAGEGPGGEPGRAASQFRHIRILSFGRKLRLLPAEGGVRRAAFDWFNAHVDLAEQQSLRPSGEEAPPTFRYELDQTALREPIEALPRTDIAGLPEEYFLHFAEDTELEYRELDGSPLLDASGQPVRALIPGCPAGTPLRPECRVQIYHWRTPRFVFHPGARGFADWMAARLVERAEGQEGIFLDEHGPGLWILAWNRQNLPRSGGRLREYSQDPLGPEANAAYNAQVVHALGVYRAALRARGKSLRINPAEYALDPQCVAQALAAGGVTTELLDRPDSWALEGGERTFQALLELARRVSALPGGTVDLMGNPFKDGFVPAGFTAGLYESAEARYHLWRLVSYYLMREEPGAPGRVYYDPTLHIRYTEPGRELEFLEEWQPAYEVDPGDPVGEPYVLARGTAGCDDAIFAREYTRGLVLLRPRDGGACDEYGDATAVTIALPGGARMHLLRADGSLAPSSDTITLRSAEAAVLLQAGQTSLRR